MSPARRWAARLGLLVAGTAVGVLLAEVGARVVQPHDAADILFAAPDNTPDGLYSTSHTAWQVPTPGFRGTQRSLGYAVDLRVNEHSLRGPAVGDKQGPRWLALGDSFTFAAQVDEADTFAARVGAQAGVELLNAGVDGYGTWPALARYRALDGPLGVDGVLLTFFVGNDFTDNHMWQGQLQQTRQMQEGLPLFRRPKPFPVGFLARNSFLYGQWSVRQRLAELQRPDSHDRQRWRDETSLFTSAGRGLLEQRIPQTRDALRALRDEAAARGDALLVAVAPPAFQIHPDRFEATLAILGLDDQQRTVDAPSDTALALLDELGIPACDLVAPLRAAHADGAQLYFRYDGHWTPEGHAVVADAIAACMETL